MNCYFEVSLDLKVTLYVANIVSDIRINDVVVLKTQGIWNRYPAYLNEGSLCTHKSTTYNRIA